MLLPSQQPSPQVLGYAGRTHVQFNHSKYNAHGIAVLQALPLALAAAAAAAGRGPAVEGGQQLHRRLHLQAHKGGDRLTSSCGLISHCNAAEGQTESTWVRHWWAQAHRHGSWPMRDALARVAVPPVPVTPCRRCPGQLSDVPCSASRCRPTFCSLVRRSYESRCISTLCPM